LGDGFLVLSGWKTDGKQLGVLRVGEGTGESDMAYIESLEEAIVTLRFRTFAKSFAFSQVDTIEKVPQRDKNSFTRAVRLSGGDEIVILLELP
jgi:hypothetical protein